MSALPAPSPLRFFDTDTEWARPLPVRWFRTDLVVAAVALSVSSIGLELSRSVGALPFGVPVWGQYALLVSASALLVVRRRWPISVGVAATVHLVVAGTLSPLIAGQVSQLVLYFCAVYSAFAWARDRRALVWGAAAVVGVVVLWSAWYFALGKGIQDVLDLSTRTRPSTGLLDPIPAFILQFTLINAAYFGGAAVLGVGSWRSAYRLSRIEAQSGTIAAQAEALQDRAVVEERLRIARELHDVVAHHVAAIGVQAAAARRTLGDGVGAAAAPLRAVEESSRSAVTEMRSLLGTLRSDGDPAGRSADRSSDPGLTDLPALAESVSTAGFRAHLDVVDGPGVAVTDVPPGIGLSLYRTAQEALANVRRHSTATSARVAVRTGGGRDSGWAEVEVLDDGRPRLGSSGSGLGLLGVRERVTSHGGECEIGPRAIGGYRVRVRLPLGGAR